MEWKKDGSGSIWRMNKEKLIFVFCSGLLLFVLSMPGTEKERSLEAAAVGSGGMENMDRSGTGRLLDGPADGPEKGELPGLSGGAQAVSGGSGGSCMKRSWSLSLIHISGAPFYGGGPGHQAAGPDVPLLYGGGGDAAGLR